MHMLPHWLELSSSIILLILLVFGVVSPYFQFNQKHELKGMKKTYIVNGMTCNHCKASVEKNLSALDGIKAVEVDLTSKQVYIDGDKIEEQAIANTINDLGFEFKGKPSEDKLSA